MSIAAVIVTGLEASTVVVWRNALTRLANCLRPPFRLILLVGVKAQIISIVCGVGPCMKRSIISMKPTVKNHSFPVGLKGSIGVV